MYQGKFNAKSRGQKNPGDTLEQILQERQEAIAAREARRNARRPASQATAFPNAGAQTRKPVSAPTQQPAARKPAAQAPAVQKRSAGKPTAVQEKPVPERRSRTGSMIFYSCYFAFILIFFVGIYFTLSWLHGWLQDYEAAQPTIKCEEVFDQLFTNPDWRMLYQLSGVQDTQFEGVDQYVEYMQSKTAGKTLNYVETSAGLSGDKKYIVRLGTEKIATFTLEGQQERITDIPDWQLGKVELTINRTQSLTIKKLEGHLVYVNNVPLDDSYTIQTATTLAETGGYLPAGTKSVQTSVQYISGLLTVPSLVVYDESGSPVSVIYNPDSGMYEEQISAIAISEEERTAVFGALESYAGFMINASGSRAGVAKYFDGSSQAYKDIVAMNSELWMNSDKGHTFKEEEILGYTQHSDSLFSVRAHLVMNATQKDGTNRDFEVTQSMFFTKKNGKWVCYEMMNLDVTQPVGKVRLTFKDNAGNTLSSDFYQTDAATVQCPVVTAPSGKIFSGWYKIDTDAAGNSTWTVVFTPDATGLVTNASGTTLTPMTLYPLFENA